MRVSEPLHDLVERVLLGAAIGDQRLGVRVVHAAHQWELGAVLCEHDGRARDRRALAHRLGDLEFQRYGTVDVDELTGRTQRVEELAEILERHSGMLHTLSVKAASKVKIYPAASCQTGRGRRETLHG